MNLLKIPVLVAVEFNFELRAVVTLYVLLPIATAVHTTTSSHPEKLFFVQWPLISNFFPDLELSSAQALGGKKFLKLRLRRSSAPIRIDSR
jgi:hypothetical protein